MVRVNRAAPVERGWFGCFAGYQACRSGFDQAGSDQTVKTLGSRVECPSQVGQAAGAKNHLPGKAGKPGKLRGRRPADAAVENPGKAADLEDQAVGVGKDMPVRALHADALLRSGDGLEAVPAKNFGCFRRQRFLFGAGLRGCRRGTGRRGALERSARKLPLRASAHRGRRGNRCGRRPKGIPGCGN